MKDIMMGDLAHTLQIPRRSLKELQQIATSEILGKVPGKLKPFNGLKADQLREELTARGVPTINKKKSELEDSLKRILMVCY